MSDIIRLRRGTAAAWTSANPILDLGEPGVETDTLKWKVGDGVTHWASLSYMAGGGGGGGAFTDLTDVPASYSGEGGNIVAVKPDETGLRFVPSLHAGTATLASGTVTVSVPWVTPTTVIVVTPQAAPGTSGTTLYVDPANIVDATSFDITSDDATDARNVFWMATAQTNIISSSGYAMKSDVSAADAYAVKDLGADYSSGDLWLSVLIGFDSGAATFWSSGGNWSGVLGVITDSGASNLTFSFDIQNATTIDWGIGEGSWTSASPAPTAGVWQLCELFINQTGSNADVKLYVNSTLAVTQSFSGVPFPLTLRKLYMGQSDGANNDAASICYFKDVKVGTTRGASDIFADDFSTNDLSNWDSTSGTITVVANPF